MSRPSTRRNGVVPYYDHGGIRIYHADLRQVFEAIIAKDRPVVVVTDPPFGVSYRSKRKETVVGDRTTELRDWMLEAWGDRPSLTFGTYRAARPLCRAMLIWDKGADPGVGDCRLPWGPNFEEVYLRGAGWVKPGKRQGSVLHFDRLRGKARPKGHPTPKPLDLMRHLLERCPAGVVLDPFMGSGATLIAAKELGRRAIGVELERRYCEITVERLKEVDPP